MRRKVKSWILITCFSLALIPSIQFKAYANDGEKQLRQGTCWCDGVTNCRYKRNGATCAARKACSVGACAQIAIAVATVIVAAQE